MRNLLLIAVCVTFVTVTTSTDSLGDKLVRALAQIVNENKEKRQGDGAGGEIVGMPLPKPISQADFKATLRGWKQETDEYKNHFKSLKPKILDLLKGTTQWENVEPEFMAFIMKGMSLSQKVSMEVYRELFRLMYKPIDFQDSGRCRNMHDVNDHLEPITDEATAGFKTITALVDDLECMTEEFSDVTEELDKDANETDLSVDEAFEMIGDVTRLLYRMGVDAKRFHKAGERNKEIWDAYHADQQQNQEQPATRELAQLLRNIHKRK